MAYFSKLDESSYYAGSFDLKDSTYDYSAPYGQLVEGQWSSGELTYAQGTYGPDVDIFDLGFLSTGTYRIQVDDYTWDYSNFDAGSVSSFSLLSSTGYAIATKYGTYSDIEFSVTQSGNYYASLTGSYGLDAQYSIKYTKTAQQLNNPATFSNPVYRGVLEPGNAISAEVSYLDLDGNSDYSVGIGWYLDGIYQFLTDSTESFVVSAVDVGKTLSFNFSFYDDLGNFEISNSYVAGKITAADISTPITYTLTSPSSVNEGGTASFTLTAKNVASGASLSYTISGVSVADVSGGLSGTAVVNASGLATISVTLLNDNLTEGAETLTVTAGGASASTTVNDTSKSVATYSLSNSSYSVNEGGTASFTLTTEDVVPGTAVPYTITGVSAADVSGGLSGTAVVNASGLATISVTLLNDNLTEGAETLTVTAGDASASTTVNDTSKIVVAGNTLDVIVDLFGTVSMLKGLIEVDNGTVHTLSYNGTAFNYAEIDPLITTVVRSGEFTAEFAQEIADAYPSVAGITYNTVVSLVGVADLDNLLIAVAGADGSYVS